MANKRTEANETEVLQAKAFIAHNLHYYARDYQSALKAYKQLLSDCESESHIVLRNKIRMELAAVTYEAFNSSFGNKENLSEIISEIRQEIVNDITSLQSTINEKDSNKLNLYSLRVGLMLNEILMELRDWEKGKDLALILIEECNGTNGAAGYLSEIYCHLGKIGIGLNDKELTLSSIEQAIILRQNKRSVWGDEKRDTLFKAFALKYAAYLHFKYPQDEIDLLKKDMYEKFSDNSGLAHFFRGMHSEK